MASTNGSSQLGRSPSGRRLEAPPRSPSTDRLAKTNSFKSPLASGGESFWKTNFRNLEQKKRTNTPDYSKSLGLGDEDEEGRKHNENYQTNFSLPPRNRSLKKPPSPGTPSAQGSLWHDAPGEIPYDSSSKMESHDSVEQEMYNHGSRYSPDKFADAGGSSPPLSQSELNGVPQAGEGHDSGDNEYNRNRMYHTQPVKPSRTEGIAENNYHDQDTEPGPFSLPAPRKPAGGLPPIQQPKKQHITPPKRDPLLQRKEEEESQSNQQQYSRRMPAEDGASSQGRRFTPAGESSSDEEEEDVTLVTRTGDDESHARHNESWTENVQEITPPKRSSEDQGRRKSVDERHTRGDESNFDKESLDQERSKRKSVEGKERGGRRKSVKGREKRKSVEDREKRKSVENRERRKSVEDQEERKSAQGAEKRLFRKEKDAQERKKRVSEDPKGRAKNPFRHADFAPERKKDSNGQDEEPSARGEEEAHKPLYPVSSYSHNFEPLVFDTDRNTIGSTPMIGIADALPRHQSLLVRIPMGDGQFMELIEGQLVKRCVLKGWVEKKPHPLLALFMNWSVKYCRIQVHTKVERVPAYNGIGFSLDERVNNAWMMFYPDNKLSTEPSEIIRLHGHQAYIVHEEKILAKHPGCFKVSTDDNDTYYAPSSTESGRRARLELMKLGKLWRRAINAAVNSKGRLFVEKFTRSSESTTSKA